MVFQLAIEGSLRRARVTCESVRLYLLRVECAVLVAAATYAKVLLPDRMAARIFSVLRLSWMLLPMLSLPLRRGGCLPDSFSVTFPLASLVFGAALACWAAPQSGNGWVATTENNNLILPSTMKLFWVTGEFRPLFAALLCMAAAHVLVPAAATLAAGQGESGAPRLEVKQELSAGGMIRVDKRDPGLTGGGSGGAATSANFDDGTLNYSRGFTGLGVKGRTVLQSATAGTEVVVDAVYFYDFLADRTNFKPLSDEARDRVVRNIYLNDGYVGVKGSAGTADVLVRVGNQILRWGSSPSWGYSIAPVNPVSASRRYQPGNTGRDAYIALPMLTGRLETPDRWSAEGFYLLGFRPTETGAAGSFLGSNDYYSPGAGYLQLGFGSPLVPDTPDSVVTPATPFGSRVVRAVDRKPGSGGQFGLRIETPEIGHSKLRGSAYAMRVHSREPIVSVNTGTLGGLLGITAPDYTSSGNYFVEYPRGVTVLGGSAGWAPAEYTRVRIEYSRRRKQPLQIDDEALITAGLAPAAATAACAPNPASALCTATLAALNRNPVIASRGGITAANAASFFSTELSGYERFGVSQYSLSLGQGLPPLLGAKQGLASLDVGGIYIHGYRDGLLDASVSTRPNPDGSRRVGLATRSAWGYRFFAQVDYLGAFGVRRVAPSLTWLHDVRGNAPITFGTLLEGSKSVILALDLTLAKALSARIAYRNFRGKGSNADRYTDRDFVSLSVTRNF